MCAGRQQAANHGAAGRDGGANFEGQDGRGRERGGERGSECGWWALINMCPFRSLIPPSLILYFPPL